MAGPSGFRDLSGLANVGTPYTTPGRHYGMVKPGNLNLNKRPVVRNPDGSVSTVKSVSWGVGGREVLMPEVVGNKVVGPRAALRNYQRTGQNLGTFTSPKAANVYAQGLHQSQAAKYAPVAQALARKGR
jgi:hypothetical protein